MNLAFVCPFYGPDAAGGAEMAARSLAWHFCDVDGVSVDVLTTCLRDLSHGLTGHVYPEGRSMDGGVTVRRFPIASGDMRCFSVLNDMIISRIPLAYADELQFMTRHGTSTAMLEYIHQHADRYDFFCFLPYLFGTTCFGLPCVPKGKRILIPCFHDEGYTDLKLVKRMTQLADRIVFNAAAEARFACRHFGEPAIQRGRTIGLGMETGITFNAARFRKRFDIKDPFILYAGRRDTTKNVHTLMDYFEDYRKRHVSTPLKLVLLGPGPLPTRTSRDGIIDLGFVSEQDKYDGMAAASLLCQPSLNESFSYVLMESWLCGTPCLVHEHCEVTRDHVVSSGGGLTFSNTSEFCAVLLRILNDTELGSQMARAGHRYVIDNYTWPVIIQRFFSEVFEHDDSALKAPCPESIA